MLACLLILNFPVTFAYLVGESGLFVEYWRNREIWAVDHSRSLKMAPIDRSYTTYYWSVIVSIAMSCTVFELFDVQNIVTLKSRLRVTLGHWKWAQYQCTLSA